MRRTVVVGPSGLVVIVAVLETMMPCSRLNSDHVMQTGPVGKGFTDYCGHNTACEQEKIHERSLRETKAVTVGFEGGGVVALVSVGGDDKRGLLWQPEYVVGARDGSYRKRPDR